MTLTWHGLARAEEVVDLGPLIDRRLEVLLSRAVPVRDAEKLQPCSSHLPVPGTIPQTHYRLAKDAHGFPSWYG